MQVSGQLDQARYDANAVALSSETSILRATFMCAGDCYHSLTTHLSNTYWTFQTMRGLMVFQSMSICKGLETSNIRFLIYDVIDAPI